MAEVEAPKEDLFHPISNFIGFHKFQNQNQYCFPEVTLHDQFDNAGEDLFGKAIDYTCGVSFGNRIVDFFQRCNCSRQSTKQPHN